MVTNDPTISVIVASHQRPEWLRRCLTGLVQLDYSPFEIIIAADDTGLAAIADHPARAQLKTILCPEANLAKTRNAGVGQAGGEVLAFIDDDAVPEPLWLRHHVNALATTGADASVGYVRGRNGISFQSRCESVDAHGETHREQSPPDTAFVPDLKPGHAVKLVGTNFTVRRAALCEVGGFDPAYRYYLDDTDLSLRLARAGRVLAVAPRAEVHHATAPSTRRTALRRPRDLFDIGRSSALFLRRHGTFSDALIDQLRRREHARLIRHMVSGTCEPRDISRLLATLDTGWQAGSTASIASLTPIWMPSVEFKAIPVPHRPHFVITSRFRGRKRAIGAAQTAAKDGQKASVFSFSLTARPHRVQFDECGVWLHTGGQFGRSVRSGPRFRWCRFAQRFEEEMRRVAMQRGIGEN